ncbi:MAG: hypothetical protein IPJ76_02480 [Flavobacteriales bacterium]|nr:MAG: hypothetical protein IPJ76_02480 [Flavobacteriales bacterium]
MVHRYVLMLLLVIGLGASAQTVFIPDVNLRGWMNNAKPNSVDANGFCDTAAWNAQPPSLLYCNLNQLPNNSTVDLEGIQHIKTSELRIGAAWSSTMNVVWPGYPMGVFTFMLINVDINNFSSSPLPLPGALDYFYCDACGIAQLPAFNGTTMFIINVDLGGQVLNVPPSVTQLGLTTCSLTQIPNTGGNLQYLNVDYNLLASWTNLPNSLVELQASFTGLAALPNLAPMTNLQYLSLAGNGHTDVVAMPPTLLSLDMSFNQIANVSSFAGADLTSLNLSNNPLVSMPIVPITLGSLRLDNTQLTALQPMLPPTLYELYVQNTPISALPALPAGVQWLDVSNTPIAQLPELPMGLNYLYATGCTALTCLPALPQGTDQVRLTGSGVTCLPNIPIGLNVNPNVLGIAPIVCNPGNSPCPIVDPLITGTTFDDADADGVFDPGEAVRPNWMVEAQPGDLMAGSDANGNYVLPAGIGSYAISAVPTLYWPPTSSPIVILTALGQVDSLNHLGAVEIGGMYDLTTEVTGTNVRPGFNTQVWVTVRNVGTEPTTADVQLTFDPALTFVSSSAAGNLNGNVLDWSTAVLVPGDVWTVDVVLYGPPTLVLGDPVVHQATATQSQPDQTAADNTDVINDVVVGSYDPNDKQVEPAYLSLADVAAGTRLHYTVRFQNTGTFMAERVLITDTLSSDLHWTTINVEAASHAHSWYLHNGVLHVLFENINLPDSTSDEPGSHGFVKFSFIATNGLVTGDVVENIANIYFDFNEPIITNTASTFVNTALGVEALSGSGLALWPVPTTDVLWLQSDAPMQRVQLLDRTGRVVRDAQANGLRAVLDVRDLSAGAYAVRCTTEQGVVQRMFVR